MIAKIKECKDLKDFIYYEFQDSGIKVDVDTSLPPDKYVGIKIDDYYAKNMPMEEPKSVDFIVSVDCQCNNYVLYILEFKNVSSPKYLSVKDIHDKFANTINDFMNNRFACFFNNDRYVFKSVFLYLVSDAYNIGDKYKSYREYHEHQSFRENIAKRDSLKVERSLHNKIFKIRGHYCKIEYEIPPNPLIKKIT